MFFFFFFPVTVNQPQPVSQPIDVATLFQKLVSAGIIPNNNNNNNNTAKKEKEEPPEKVCMLIRLVIIFVNPFITKPATDTHCYVRQ